MNTVARLRQAGFSLAITDDSGLWVEPASRLTDQQRAYIRAHKVLLLEELRAEIGLQVGFSEISERFPVMPVMPEPSPLTVAFDQDAFEERAAILEFEAGASRDEAERRARALLDEEEETTV